MPVFHWHPGLFVSSLRMPEFGFALPKTGAMQANRAILPA
jgi:hypothetical protein